MTSWMRRYAIIGATLIVLAAVILLSVSGAGATARWVAIVYVTAFILWTVARMVRDVLRGHVGLDVLAVVAMVATLAVGEYIASLVIVLMLAGGEALEDYAGRRATRELTALLDRSPQIAHVLVHPNSGSDEVQDAAADDV